MLILVCSLAMNEAGVEINDSHILKGVVPILITFVFNDYITKYNELKDQKQILINNLHSFVKSGDTTEILKWISAPQYFDLYDFIALEDPNDIYKKSSSFLSTIHFENDKPINFKNEPITIGDYIHHKYKDLITRLHKLTEPIEKIDVEIKNLFKINNNHLTCGVFAIVLSVLILFLESITWSENEYSYLFIKLADFWFQIKLPFIGFILFLVVLYLEGFVKSFLDK